MQRRGKERVRLGGALALFGWALAAPAGADVVYVNNFDGPNIQAYDDGVLQHTFTGTGDQWEGASLTPDGHLVTTYRSGGPVNPGINIFSPDGMQVASFGTPAITSDFPGDVSVFADGTLAISDQFGDAIQMYDQSGQFLRTVNLPAGTHPVGSTVGADGILYVAGQFANDIVRIEEDGTQLGSIALGFGPGEVTRAADGTLWVSDSSSGNAVHIKTDGTVLLSFNIGLGLSGEFVGLALAPDGDSLYATRTTSTIVKQFDLSGSQIGQFDIEGVSTPAFLTAASSTAAPEPSGLALAGIGATSCLGAIAGRRRRKRAAYSQLGDGATA